MSESELPVTPPAGAPTVADVMSTSTSSPEWEAAARFVRAGERPHEPHPTVEERVARGRQARSATPRQELGRFQPAANRPDPIAQLQGQELSRVQELVPVRHARMATSAFAFYRGSALVMASDLAEGARSGLDVQLCGDAHLANFGMFAAPDRSLVFDVNDFDETNPGPFEWDVKRLAASFVLAARENRLSASAAREAASAATSSYRASMAAFAGKPEIEIWYDRVDVTGLQAILPDLAQSESKAKKKEAQRVQAVVNRSVAAARARTQWSAIAKITEVVDGRRQFRNQPPLLTRLEIAPEVREVVDALFREYRSTLQDDRRELLRRYEIIDIGHKVVGVGSVGLLAMVLLMRGRDDSDLMVLQVKQAQSSVLEAFTQKSALAKHGERVVTGQRLMQAASDSFLGWIDGPGGRSFYVRQLRDMKWSPDVASANGVQLRRYAQLCGHTLARAHARSGDAIAIAAYLGSGTAFDDAVTAYALAYADQVAVDFAAFTAAIADGRLSAHESQSMAQAAATAELLAATGG